MLITEILAAGICVGGGTGVAGLLFGRKGFFLAPVIALIYLSLL